MKQSRFKDVSGIKHILNMHFNLCIAKWYKSQTDEASQLCCRQHSILGGVRLHYAACSMNRRCGAVNKAVKGQTVLSHYKRLHNITSKLMRTNTSACRRIMKETFQSPNDGGWLAQILTVITRLSWDNRLQSVEKYQGEFLSFKREHFWVEPL